jgi:hypothetical protein
MTEVTRRTIPSIEGFRAIKLQIECPSIALLEFMGAKASSDGALQLSELQVWTFAFFDFAIHNLDVTYDQHFPLAQSITITPIQLGECKFEVDVVLDPGAISLRCREFHFFDRVSTEYVDNQWSRRNER